MSPSSRKQLDEGRTVEFNAMFMDRYLWNLQFGTSQRIVPKKRASGRPDRRRGRVRGHSGT